MDGPTELWRMRKQFSLQIAASNVMTYIFCLTSRTPMRFHISRTTGLIAMSELLPGMTILYSYRRRLILLLYSRILQPSPSVGIPRPCSLPFHSQHPALHRSHTHGGHRHGGHVGYRTKSHAASGRSITVYNRTNTNMVLLSDSMILTRSCVYSLATRSQHGYTRTNDRIRSTTSPSGEMFKLWSMASSSERRISLVDSSVNPYVPCYLVVVRKLINLLSDSIHPLKRPSSRLL